MQVHAQDLDGVRDGRQPEPDKPPLATGEPITMIPPQRTRSRGLPREHLKSRTAGSLEQPVIKNSSRSASLTGRRHVAPRAAAGLCALIDAADSEHPATSVLITLRRDDIPVATERNAFTGVPHPRLRDFSPTVSTKPRPSAPTHETYLPSGHEPISCHRQRREALPKPRILSRPRAAHPHHTIGSNLPQGWKRGRDSCFHELRPLFHHR